MNPENVIFKDFSVGKVYQQRVVLTNGSYSFNSFKIEQLATRLREHFKIEYELPPRMSAGTSWPIVVHFSPHLNEDIEGDISILTETGSFIIKLYALTKKVRATHFKVTLPSVILV